MPICCIREHRSHELESIQYPPGELRGAVCAAVPELDWAGMG